MPNVFLSVSETKNMISFYQDDTINLFTYALLRLTPRALNSGASSWSYLRKGNTPGHISMNSNPLNSSSISQQSYASRDANSVGGISYPVIRPLQKGKWSRGKDGFLVPDFAGIGVDTVMHATPTVWLHQSGESVYLCAYQFRNLTLLLLIPTSATLEGDQGLSAIKNQLIEDVRSLTYMFACAIII